MANTTEKMKCALLHYIRFKRQAYVATEVNYNVGIADILFIPKNGKKIYEVECKISKSDFLNEWKKKEHKHSILQNKANFFLNYYYFCVPKELEEFALEQIKDLPYGLLVYKEQWYYKNKLEERLELSDSVVVVKTAKDLVPNEENTYYEKLKDLICLRSMTEVATMYKEKVYGGGRNPLILREKEKVNG